MDGIDMSVQERTTMKDVVIVTPLGHMLLEQKKVYLENALVEAQEELGDLSSGDNGEGFQDSFVLQRQMDAQRLGHELSDVTDVLRKAQIAGRPEKNGPLAIGHRAGVTLDYPFDESESLTAILLATEEMALVEAYLADGEVPVSAHSALGKAIYGCEKGARFSYEIESGAVHGQILNVGVWRPAFETEEIPAPMPA
jgi:hypothetical protein